MHSQENETTEIRAIMVAPSTSLELNSRRVTSPYLPVKVTSGLNMVSSWGSSSPSSGVRKGEPVMMSAYPRHRKKKTGGHCVEY